MYLFQLKDPFMCDGGISISEELWSIDRHLFSHIAISHTVEDMLVLKKNTSEFMETELS